MRWYLAALKNYVGFTGRARRKEYWMFVLFNIIICVVLYVADNLIGWQQGFINAMIDLKIGFYDVGPLLTLYQAAAFLPALALNVRRLHDVERSGWSLLIVVVPLIGVLVLLFLCASKGTDGQNKYGPDPKQNECPPLFRPSVRPVIGDE